MNAEDNTTICLWLAREKGGRIIVVFGLFFALVLAVFWDMLAYLILLSHYINHKSISLNYYIGQSLLQYKFGINFVF